MNINSFLSYFCGNWPLSSLMIIIWDLLWQKKYIKNFKTILKYFLKLIFNPLIKANQKRLQRHESKWKNLLKWPAEKNSEQVN